MFESKVHSDFEIHCQNKIIKVHKDIISSQGGFFEVATKNGFQVSRFDLDFGDVVDFIQQEGTDNVIDLSDEDYDVIVAVTQYLYGIMYSVPEGHNPATFHATMYAASEYYQLPLLKKGELALTLLQQSW